MAAPLLTRIAWLARSDRSDRAAAPHDTDRQALQALQALKDNDVEGAILSHLHQMLNTRRGSCLTCPDYGLVDVSELLDDFPDAIATVQRSIKTSVQTYEPRLKNAQVRHLKGDGRPAVALHFEISGQLHLPDGRKRTLSITAEIDPSGSVRLEI
jgi:type VI secretion system protein